MPYKWNPFTSNFDLIDDSATGDVVGPSSSTDENIAIFDGTTGKLIKDGGVGLPQNDGELIIGDTSGDAQTSTLTGGTGITVTNGAGSVTIDADNNGDVTAAANLDDFAVVCGDGGAKGVQTIASVGTTGQVLTSNGSGALPTFEDAAGGGGPLLKYWKASDLDALETNFAPLNQDDGSNASILVRSFDDTTEEFVNFSMSAPNGLDTTGTVTFRAYVYAETAAASVNVQLRLGHISANSNDSWDVAYSNEDSGDVALSATQDQITIAEWTETVTNLGWAADDLLLLRLSRISPTGTDLTGDLQLIGFSVEVPQ